MWRSSQIPGKPGIAWDSLGEGYLYLIDETKYLEAYEKSLEMNPENRNAEKKIEFMKEYLYDIARETATPAQFFPGTSTGIKGPYFGQDPPGNIPKLCAPGLVSTRGNAEYSCTFSTHEGRIGKCPEIQTVC